MSEATMAGHTKTCPACAEEIQARANKCRYCGEWISEGFANRDPGVDSRLRDDFAQQGDSVQTAPDGINNETIKNRSSQVSVRRWAKYGGLVLLVLAMTVALQSVRYLVAGYKAARTEGDAPGSPLQLRDGPGEESATVSGESHALLGCDSDPSIRGQSESLLARAVPQQHGLQSCVFVGDLEVANADRQQNTYRRREHEFYARGYYMNACERDEKHACARLGYMYRQDRGLKGTENDGSVRWPGESYIAYDWRIGPFLPRPRLEAEWLSQACDESREDFGDSCAYLGYFHEQGIGLQQDLGLAAATYRRACDAGSPLGCTELSRMYSKGLGVERSRREAKRWTKEAGRMIERRMNMKYPIDVGTPR